MFDSYNRKSLKFLLEDDKEEQKDKKSIDTAKLKQKINKIYSQSDAMQSAEKAAREVLERTLKAAKDKVAAIYAAKDVNQLEKAVGGSLKGKDEINKLSADKRKKAEEEFLNVTKEQAKILAIDRLTKEVAPVREKFGKNFPFVVRYDETISDIRKITSSGIKQ